MAQQQPKVSVCVVGGGVVGVSTALQLLEHPQHASIQVTIIAEDLTPNTTGDGSAGFWMPYLIPNNPLHKKYQWCADTFRHLESLHKKSSNSNDIGINLLSGYILFGEGEEVDPEDTYWMDLVYGCRQVTDEELKMFPDAKSGLYFTTYTLECVKYLPYLLEKFTKLGGKVIQKKINRFNELYDSYDMICNCTGYGARHLAADDSVVAIRGQVVRVSAPWLKHFVTLGDNYILPNAESVVLGGSHEEADECARPYHSVTQFILDGCARLVPSLRDARIIRHWVGLRPGRPTVRIELDTSRTHRGRPIPIVHNYGHAGSGVTIHWGCARDCVDLVYHYINHSVPLRPQRSLAHASSKL